ncbi:MAG: type VI secretion system tube protein Hcp [Candidatus Contendobacter sp.]|nr:type VI secretion system tube protein Hcp [Candidatus Contendobacter sp.]
MAFDTFLKIDGVEGESTDDKHKGEIEIYSFSWGASNPTTIGSATSGSGGGKVSVSSFNVMKKTDKASAELFKHCCKGTHFATAKVTLRKAGGEQVEYLVYDFEEVYVDAVQWSGSTGGDDSPTESVAFTFGKVSATYKPQAADGTLGGDVLYSHDLRTNITA